MQHPRPNLLSIPGREQRRSLDGNKDAGHTSKQNNAKNNNCSDNVGDALIDRRRLRFVYRIYGMRAHKYLSFVLFLFACVHVWVTECE
jgi:hypothetical protein